MKLLGTAEQNHVAKVAPCAGAWVEIAVRHSNRRQVWSPPVRGRGLKCHAKGVSVKHDSVAPCAGAWVEIFSLVIVDYN